MKKQIVSIPHRYSTTTVFMRLTQYVVTKHSIKHAKKSVNLFSRIPEKPHKIGIFENRKKLVRDRPTFCNPHPQKHFYKKANSICMVGISFLLLHMLDNS